MTWPTDIEIEELELDIQKAEHRAESLWRSRHDGRWNEDADFDAAVQQANRRIGELKLALALLRQRTEDEGGE